MAQPDALRAALNSIPEFLFLFQLAAALAGCILALTLSFRAPVPTPKDMLNSIRGVEHLIRALGGRTETLRLIEGFAFRTLNRERLLDAQIYLESLGVFSLRDPEPDETTLYLIVANPALTPEKIGTILSRYGIEAELCHVEVNMVNSHAEVHIKFTC